MSLAPSKLHWLLASLVSAACAGSSACAGSTRTMDPAEGALGQLPGRWENAFIELETSTGPLRMHYTVAGPKDAPRLILLHGFPDFAYTWRELVPMLSGDYRVLAPDLRGYAATGKPRKGYDLDTLAADIIAFADATAKLDGAPADRPTHLLGHDWGAAVGWWAVLAAPKRFATYTAISVAHPRAFTEFLKKSEEQRKKSKYMRKLTLPLVPLFFAGMSDKRRRAIYRDDLTRKDAFGDNDLVWYRAAFDSAMETRPPLRYYKQKFRNADENEQAARKAPAIGIPVLVLWGKNDKHLMAEMAPDSCKYVLPDLCQVEVLPTATHWVHWDDPKAVATRWRAFIESMKDVIPAGTATPATPESGAPATPDVAAPATPAAPAAPATPA